MFVSLENPLPVTPFKAINGNSPNSPKTPIDPPSPMGPLVIDEAPSKPMNLGKRSESPDTDIESIPNDPKVSISENFEKHL